MTKAVFLQQTRFSLPQTTKTTTTNSLYGTYPPIGYNPGVTPGEPSPDDLPISLCPNRGSKNLIKRALHP